ncbi:hypothetical protein FSP39_021076 [Pinctada imbricata]|uniref:GH18 domain-containing protein n=1 Tax=Pinctada imbricata TaxID=66713 RepID=A0AA88XJY7_PINIB|nr:hypothetical protein FSP39_021076 [Pinctada imbricata]
MCYYTNWSQYRVGDGKFLPEDIDAFLCTHIMYAFAKLNGNSLTNYEWNDPDNGGTQGLYSRVMNMREANPSLKVILTLGGANAPSADFSTMVSTILNRGVFVSSAVQFLRQHRFDGLDMDWEYPTQRGGSPGDFTNFGLLMQELRSEFEAEALVSGKERLLLTVAVPPSKSIIDSSFDVPTISANVDYVGVMAYNFFGSWNTETGHNSPLYASSGGAVSFSMSYAVNYWHQLGVPKDKIVVGMAAYGRSFTLSDPNNYGVGAPTGSGSAPSGTYTGEAGFLSYYEICMKQVSGAGNTYRDDSSKVPYYVEGTTWIGFDDEDSIYNKVRNFIIPQGYAGAMIWALPLDDFKPMCGANRYPLVKKIKEAFDEVAVSK